MGQDCFFVDVFNANNRLRKEGFSAPGSGISRTDRDGGNETDAAFP